MVQIFSLFNTQPNRPRALSASFKHVGQTLYSRGFKFGENGPIKIFCTFLPPGRRWLNLVQIFSLFNTQPYRPRALSASFKHVGQTLYSRGFKFGENGPSKIFCPFLPPGPRWLNLVQLFSLFNTQPNRPRALPASFKIVGHTLYSRGFKFGENGPIKIFCPFLPPGPRWLNLVQIFSLFNTQPNRPRALSASFKHVGQTLYSRGFKFGENGPIKILVHFCLQVRDG